MPKTRTDSDRLNWLADNQIIEGFTNINYDVHQLASDEIVDDESLSESAAYRIAIRKLIDDAMDEDIES